VALGALLLLPLGLGAFAAARAPVVQAQRVELVTARGAVQAVLTADTAGVSLTLLDAKGRAVSGLRLTRDTILSVLDGAGRPVAMLGGPQVRHLTE
jgi:hypothetical protein